MQVLLSIKLDPRMKTALKKVSDKQFISVSAAVKQAIERYLQEHDVDWRNESKIDKNNSNV
ncbi:MAG: hypothetical protein ABIF87_01945 [Pseudomonadota bacterium]